MIKINQNSFYTLLPPNLQNNNTLALSAALEKEFSELVNQIKKVFIYADIMSIDENLCDFLAIMFDIKSYNQTFPLDVKRELVKISLNVSFTNGTAQSVNDVLKTIHSTAKTEEWFEFNGEPFTFNVIVGVANGINMDSIQTICDEVTAQKNVRSHLKKIKWVAESRAVYKVGAYPRLGVISVVLPLTTRSIENKITIKNIVFAKSGIWAKIKPKEDEQ